MAFRHTLRRFGTSYTLARLARPATHRQPRLQIENLEDRTLLSVSLVAAPGGLFDVIANGSAANDDYHVRLDTAGTVLQIFENDPLTGPPSFSIAKAAVRQLIVNG